MKIQLNGRIVDFDQENGTIYDLLSAYQLENRVVIVEKNQEIIDKEAFQQVVIQPNDTIEIVHFVGGG
ncbi:thiamine biosynthesis protein ThiS [Bacillus pumilus]|jgi:sulfur carrier protein|uniref:sulfur carrier protein ThiS n=1 Tax=Bacillus TaxID=1386 RepID=UPI00057FE2C5|nr:MULTISPECIES: sulfur carrier protein ThiS [Bacillus]KLL01501.1 thiamine biosynthesis protein ThiS [Bacillus pumilus]MBW4850177.1 sulfur carrier protein ThiS [Bacillaceae bacterium]AIZ59765.1 thiamine biosynthesis protein ThiS [Bacillus sp. WP8]KMK71343.1 thiamine biosynthesis protein ThiS [Bacillus safensis]KUF22265.1 thiamine biosynthesis protein ThiS [Bacillus sp. G1(2015b)]